MAAFTEVTNGFAPQSNMAEIVNAVNERRAAAVASGAWGLPAALDNPQSFQGGDVKPVHLLMQEMLEALAPKYVAHDQAAYNDASETLPIAPYTVSTWRTAAGLNSSGYRRVATWANPAIAPTFDYGPIQTGDIAGYWIWEDIVAGLRALKWTQKAPTLTGVDLQHRHHTSNFTYPYASVAAAQAAGDAWWASEPWSAGGGWNNLDQEFSVVESWVTPGAYDFSAYSVRSKMGVAFATNAPVGGTVQTIVRLNPHTTYFDLNGRTVETWTDHEAVAFAAGATTAIGSVFTITAGGTPFASSGAVGSTGSHAWVGGGMACIIKWNFSHS